MSRQNTVEQAVAAGQTASLCLTRDSIATVSAVHCRRTEDAGAASPGTSGAPQRTEAAPPDDAPAQQPPAQAASARMPPLATIT
ncbi:hypothetical protein ACFQU7_14650 [Pseudoroseomonas wenyumeiae]